MTQQEFRNGLAALRITQVEAARRLGVEPRTVRRWALGERKVPGPVEAAFRCWLNGDPVIALKRIMRHIKREIEQT